MKDKHYHVEKRLTVTDVTLHETSDKGREDGDLLFSLGLGKDMLMSKSD